MDHQLMPIGRFSQVSRLSVKALRLYDAEGLLRPAWVDPASGYRHYRPDQIRRAETIKVLRMVDMPLDGIREVLALEDPDAVRAALEAHRSRLAATLAQQERMLRFLGQLMHREDLTMPYDVTTTQIAAQRVIGHRVHTSLEDVGAAVASAFGAAAQAAAAAQAPIVGPPFIVYHDVIDQQTAGEIEGCVPVPPGTDGEGAYDIPAATVASTVHRGPYMEIGPAYEAMAGWLAQHGHEPAGPPREVYLNDPQETPEEELLTQVQFPIAFHAGS